MMRIALFHTTLPESGRKLGGVEVAVHRLANALVDLGRDAVTVFSLTPAPADARYAHVCLFGGSRALRDTKFGRLVLIPALLNTVDFSTFDVVHLHGDDWFFGLRNVPTLRTLHGSALREAAAATSRKRRWLQSLIYPLEHLSARLCTTALAGGADAATVYGISDSVSYGVDEAVFHAGPKTERPRVLYVGTWEGRKRGQFVFDAFVNRVLPAVPDAELCMVSDVCPSHPSVIAESFPSDALLAQRYRESWVFALASTYEGFGIPYIEALASGTPVVTSPNPGAAQILADGAFGVLADDASFADHVIRLLRDGDERARLAREGLARAADFTWPRVAEQHRALYQQTMDRWARSSPGMLHRPRAGRTLGA